MLCVKVQPGGPNNVSHFWATRVLVAPRVTCVNETRTIHPLANQGVITDTTTTFRPTSPTS